MPTTKKRAARLRVAVCLVFAVLLAVLLPLMVFAADKGLSRDRNGTAYTYVIGYCYTGWKGGINTREVFTSPNNYAVWLCPTCGASGTGSSGTGLAENQYLPCYGYDIAATGGDTWIRYAKVRHRHNNGSLSNDIVYISINVAQYSGCYYAYDNDAPSGGNASGPAGWQKNSATVTFGGGTDTGTSLPDWAASPGNHGSGIHHHEYRLDGGGWTGCPVGQPNVVITKGGATTVTARTVDGAGNASSQPASTTVYIDNVAPNAPTVTPSTTAWTNQNVTVTLKDNGDTYSGVNRVEYSLDGGAYTRYGSPLTVSAHGRHSVTGRVADNVGHVSGTASAAILIDKVAPVITSVTQTPNARRTELAFTVTATDADSGVAGYAVTASKTAPPTSAFSASMPKVTKNGTWYLWARDNAGNISAATEARVVALDSVPPVVSASTQRTWDSTTNWAKLTATDDNSGVAQIGWSLASNGTGITWANATANHTFNFGNNGTYYAYAKDVAGNISKAVAFTIDRIDKHSPDITDVTWERAWTQTKTVTVTAVDTESGMGQYAMTRTKDRPTKWQDSNVFPGITENGIYYLWAKDNVGRVSADPDADGSGGKGPGPVEIVIDTIDRSKPVMDAIIHSATDNAPQGAFSFPHFNEVDRPELLAHDVGDDGGAGSGIRAIYYQFVPDGGEIDGEWQLYDDAERPAMTDKFLGRIVARAEDNAGNISEPMDATFLFETTKPEMVHALEPGGWTNTPVTVALAATDDFSGVRDITLPDDTVVEADEAHFTAEENGIYTVHVRDNAGNVLAYEVDVWNIDTIPPEAEHTLSPDTWTNKPVTITVEANDPAPEDGYKPSDIASITLPDGTVVEGDTAEFVVEKNGEYTFTVTDNGGNSIEYPVEVSNIDLLPPEAEYILDPDVWTNKPVTITVNATDPAPEDDYKPSGIASITLPDGTVVAGDTAEFIVKENGVYTFIVTDRGGNSTEYPVEVSNIDLLSPEAEYTLDPDVWTNKPITITLTATDPDPEDGYDPSGIASITLPDGTVVEGDTAELVVDENGEYTFIVTDNGGNRMEYIVTVDNFDDIPPVVDFHFTEQPHGEKPYPDYGETEYYNYNIALFAQGKDADSGIDFYEYRIGGGAWARFDPKQPPIISDEQISTVYVRVWDVAGNVSETKSRNIVLDKTAPIPSHTLEPDGWTQGKVIIHINANYDICGPQSLVLPDGRVVYATTSATFEVTRNGQYTFIFWDMCGNRANYTVTVGNIFVPEPAVPEKPDSQRPQSPAKEQPADPEAPPFVFAEVAQPQPPTLRLTLLDLLLAVISTLCAVLALLRRRRTEEDEAGRERRRRTRRIVLPNILTALAAIVLFFLTQPLVWRFRLVDWWTILFAVISALSLWLFMRNHKENNEPENEEEF